MAQKVLKPCEVTVGNLTFSEPKKLPNGGNMVYVNNSGGPLYVQTPRVNVLWDTKYYADNDSSGKYTIQFSLTEFNNNSTMKSFHDMMVQLDTRVVDYALDNRKEWFGPKFSKTTRETIETMYTPMIKVSVDQETGEPNGKFPPRFGFKIVKRDGSHQCKVYDNNRNMFNIDNDDGDDFKSLADDVLTKGAGMNVVLRCNGVWVINGKFGCTWRAEQLKVEVAEKSINGYAFRDDDDDMDVVEKPVEKPVENNNAPPPQVVDSVSDSDSDSDSDEEPVKKPVKKRGVKKQ